MRILSLVIWLPALLAVSGAFWSCAKCTASERCPSTTQSTLDRVINSNTNYASPLDKKAQCEVSAYRQSVDFGPGCAVEWK